MKKRLLALLLVLVTLVASSAVVISADPLIPPIYPTRIIIPQPDTDITE